MATTTGWAPEMGAPSGVDTVPALESANPSHRRAATWSAGASRRSRGNKRDAPTVWDLQEALMREDPQHSGPMLPPPPTAASPAEDPMPKWVARVDSSASLAESDVTVLSDDGSVPSGNGSWPRFRKQRT